MQGGRPGDDHSRYHAPRKKWWKEWYLQAVKPADVACFKIWFNEYSRNFVLDDREGQKNIDLKIEHTFRVCSLILRIAEGEAADSHETLLAETAALFHDLGRFPQYRQYRTFRDSLSINHGRLGAEVLRQEHVLDHLPEEEQAAILNAVQFHNAFAIPERNSEGQLRLLRMVRDADKLDIWRIFLGFYEGAQAGIPSEAGMGLPDLPTYSDEVLKNIERGHTASMAHLRTLNDFKLMLMSWAYDLNFITSIRLLAEQDYINRLSALLPRDEVLDQTRTSLLLYVRDRLAG
ncbi:MAG: HD family phosphohydrolase [Thermodesulfovibrio sp.]|nr:HD family phosphohydrolase [Thermodesulfovibrio sp.]